MGKIFDLTFFGRQRLMAAACLFFIRIEEAGLHRGEAQKKQTQ